MNGGKTYMGMWEGNSRFILKREKEKATWVSPFVGEGSRASCLSLEGSKLSRFPGIEILFRLIHFLHHRAADSFQNKDRSHVLEKQQCWLMQESISSFEGIVKGPETPFNETPIANALLFLLENRLICWIQFKRFIEAKTGQTHTAHSGHSSSNWAHAS